MAITGNLGENMGSVAHCGNVDPELPTWGFAYRGSCRLEQRAQLPEGKEVRGMSLHLLEGLLYLRNWLRREEGQGLVEYALIIVLIAIAVIVALTALGGGIASTFSRINAALGF